MTLPYFVRLALLSLAVYFLIHLAIEILAALLTPRAIRSAARQAPARAARDLLTLRLAPTAIAQVAVIIFCIPSYLWLEPDRVESVSLRCFALAALAFAVWAISARRTARAVGDSRSYLRDSLAAGRQTAWPSVDAAVWVTDHPGPAVALAGIFRPRVLISRAAAAALTSDQLDAALRHERAHARSRDNFKRLAVLLAPRILPGRAALEQEWARAAERAADDRATGGDPGRALALAEALVRVSRLGLEAQAPRLVTSLADNSGDLKKRVDRLLNPVTLSPSKPPLYPTAVWIAFTFAALLGALLDRSTLHTIHELLEKLI